MKKNKEKRELNKKKREFNREEKSRHLLEGLDMLQKYKMYQRKRKRQCNPYTYILSRRFQKNEKSDENVEKEEDNKNSRDQKRRVNTGQASIYPKKVCCKGILMDYHVTTIHFMNS
jgi:hypothetical protein